MKIVLQRRERAKSMYNHCDSDAKKEIPDEINQGLAAGGAVRRVLTQTLLPQRNRI